MEKGIVFCLAILGLFLGIAPAATVHDEAVDGDASTIAGSPTSITLAPGGNTIIGSVTTSADTRDFYTFTIPAGFEMTALRIDGYDDPATGPSDDGNTGFHHLDAGTTTVVPSGGTSSQLLGGDHLSGSDVGTNALPSLAAGTTAGTGFSTPLPAGNYCYNIQQTGPQVSEYEIRFVITAVPTTIPARPDLSIGITSANANKGSGVFNLSTVGQTISDTTTNSGPARFYIRAVNPGTVTGLFRFNATRSTAFFTASYFDITGGQNTNITSQMITGVYSRSFTAGLERRLRADFRPSSRTISSGKDRTKQFVIRGVTPVDRVRAVARKR